MRGQSLLNASGRLGASLVVAVVLIGSLGLLIGFALVSVVLVGLAAVTGALNGSARAFRRPVHGPSARRPTGAVIEGQYTVLDADHERSAGGA